MIRVFFVAIYLFTSNCIAQHSSRWQGRISAEAYGLELYRVTKKGGDATISYCGQTLSGVLGYRLGDRWEIGMEAGIYYHQRARKDNSYLYLPLQLNFSYYSRDRRVELSFSTGYPFKLHEYRPYIGQYGFWYRDTAPDSPAYGVSTGLKRTGLHNVSNLRFKFRVTHSEHFFITTGLRYLLYSAEVNYYSSTGTPLVDKRGPYSYVNFSLGLEYKL